MTYSVIKMLESDIILVSTSLVIVEQMRKEIKMKLILSFALTGLFLVGCGTTNRMTTIPDENLIDISKNDQEQYELIVLDPGFDTWYATTWSPAKDHAESYYSYWNQRYVTAWNYKATRPLTAKYFENIINFWL